LHILIIANRAPTGNWQSNQEVLANLAERSENTAELSMERFA
jgi:hypothetical protein